MVLLISYRRHIYLSGSTNVGTLESISADVEDLSHVTQDRVIGAMQGELNLLDSVQTPYSFSLLEQRFRSLAGWVRWHFPRPTF